MRLISLGFVLISITLAGCKHDNGAACDVVADCDDQDPCTSDTCPGSVCVHELLTTPECGMDCDVDQDCADENVCTIDTCGNDLRCANTPIPGCGSGPCEEDTDCYDGDLCTDDACGNDHLCAHTADTVTPACVACNHDGACDPTDTCACAECETDVRCFVPDDCVEIIAPDVTAFNEGGVTGADGSDLEGAGSDTFQAFPSGSPEGVVDFTEITDHDQCFATGGCAQIRLNYDTGSPVEGMFTTGAWQHNADGSGEIYNATAYEYTQGAGGTMNYVTDGKCWHADHVHHEP